MKAIAIITCVALLASGATPSIALAQSASGLGDLVGVRGPGAESELSSRGYAAAGNNGAASMWWNGARGRCVSMLVEGGRVQSIQAASPGDCGQSGGRNDSGSSAGAAVAGLAAIGLIAALASHKKHSDRSHFDGNHDGEYARGYNDGLYGGTYDRNDTEAYHEGYFAGEAERDNRVAANSRFVRGAPPVANAACAQRGDQFFNLPAGSAVPVSVFSYGQGLYEVTVAAGHYRARCSVDGSGRVSNIDSF